jgi:hypothetical protein
VAALSTDHTRGFNPTGSGVRRQTAEDVAPRRNRTETASRRERPEHHLAPGVESQEVRGRIDLVPTVEVTIGTIDVKTTAPQLHEPAPRRQRAIGFDEFAATRSYRRG